jgi:hypothetical protein
MFNNPILAHCDAVTQKWEVPCIRLKLTRFQLEIRHKRVR